LTLLKTKGGPKKIADRRKEEKSAVERLALRLKKTKENHRLSPFEMSLQQTTGMIDGIPVVFRDVWAHNLKEEMNRICELVEKYPYIAMVNRIW
jgi:hypothetical protein